MPPATENSSFKGYQYPVGFTGVLNIPLLEDQTAPLGAKNIIKVLLPVLMKLNTWLTPNRMFGNETLTQLSKIKLVKFNSV